MRYRKALILFFSIGLVALIYRVYKLNDPVTDMPLTAAIVSGEYTEEIPCWKDQWNNYYFFLPGYADLSAVRIRSHTKDEIWIGDHMITSKGVSCDKFRLNETYGLARIGKKVQYDGVVWFVQSGNVPTLYIDSASGSMEYIHAEKGNEESAQLRLYSEDGQLENAVAVEALQGRGNATWDLEKKAYSLRLTEEADLLGMGNARRWILLANG